MSNVISNVEFDRLVDGRSNWLKQLARVRVNNNKVGSVSLSDLEGMISACQATGNQGDVTWLKNLKFMHVSGKLDKLRDGETTWEDHVVEVKSKVAQQQIPFDINDYVIVKESGKSGTIADYIVDKDEYVVVLNPFQVVYVPAKDLIRGKVP